MRTFNLTFYKYTPNQQTKSNVALSTTDSLNIVFIHLPTYFKLSWIWHTAEVNASFVFISEYAQNNYNTNSARAQTSSYRGTPAPAPAVQATSVREEAPKRGKPVYVQNNNYNQDIYQQSTVADYHDDNRYDAQVS